MVYCTGRINEKWGFRVSGLGFLYSEVIVPHIWRVGSAFPVHSLDDFDIGF